MACEVTDPPAFVAISVYVVVEAGETETEVPVTAPIPEMLSEVAPVVVQERVADWPAVMLAGDATNEEMAGGKTGVGFTVKFWLLLVPFAFVTETL